MSESSISDRLREFFVLREAEALSTKVPADLRESVARDVTIARQKREAAEVLWLGGAPAEGLLLARDALDRIALAVERAHEGGAGPALPSKAMELRTDVAAKPLPALDSEVGDADSARFYAMIATHDQLRSLAEPAGMTKTEVVRRRRTRTAWAAGAAVALVLTGYFAVRTPRTLKAAASTVYDETHNGAQAVDGRTETEWLLPNKQLGWVELTVLPSRKVKRIKLLNGHNPPYNDRQTKDFHLDVLGSGGKVLKTVDSSFGDFNATPSPLVLELDTAERVERIRLEVRSFHKDGAALAEVEVE